MTNVHFIQHHKARGALSNIEGRFEKRIHESIDDGWCSGVEISSPLQTEVMPDKAKKIITYNTSPDIPFDRSVNPYRGCEHGCIYCFARPTHGYLGLSSGLDFETKIFYKENAAALLEKELSRPDYVCRAISLGINTDAYQPVEKELEITRSLLSVLLRYRHPVSLITKSSLILRDLDILREMAEHNLVSVAVSMTSMSNEVKSTLEPRAASPVKRLEIMEKLSAEGIPVSVLVAPVIPVITDHEMEVILKKAFDAGARSAGYVLLRLPYEVKDLFRQWLVERHPHKAEHVMNLVQQSRGGKDYDAQWGIRMKGKGQYADMLAQRFSLAVDRYGYKNARESVLDESQFTHGQNPSGQMQLDL